MIATTKRIAAIGSMIALVALTGCASFEANVDYDGNGSAGTHSRDDLLKQMHADSQGA
jgi:hypothetical protein